MSRRIVDTIGLDKSNKKSQPLYQQIRRQLRNVINKDTILHEGDRLPSISVLAKELDVNYRTIKTAFDLLAKEGLIKIEPGKGAIVTRKNALAAWKATQKLSMSFITCRHCDGFFVHVNEGIKRFALEHKLDYSLADVGNSRERFIDATESLVECVDGLLVLPLERPGYAEALCKALESGVKIVQIDRSLPGVETSSVESDHFTGAYLATNHLLKEHGRPVYYLGFVDKPSSCRAWVMGWGQAMSGYNYRDLEPYCFALGVYEEEVSDRDMGLEYDVKAALHLFESRDEDVYCIYAGNDFIARGVYQAAARKGLTVGRNLFVVGYNDMPFCTSFSVPLSTIRQLPSIEQIGYEAAKVLYEHMIGIIQRPVRRLLPVELVVRESSVLTKT